MVSRTITWSWTMKITITFSEDVQVASRVGPNAPITTVATALKNALPGLLQGSKMSARGAVTPLAVDVELYRFPESRAVDIWIKVSDADPSMHDVMVMPYDKVWRTIMDWFRANKWLFPVNFYYDTGEHGMYNIEKAYQSW